MSDGIPFLTQVEIETCLRAMVRCNNEINVEEFLEMLEELLLFDAIDQAELLSDLTLPNVKLDDLKSLERASDGSGENNPHYNYRGYPNNEWVELIADAAAAITDEQTIWGEQYNWGDLDVKLANDPALLEDI